jgi:hypothetical protein
LVKSVLTLLRRLITWNNSLRLKPSPKRKELSPEA